MTQSDVFAPRANKDKTTQTAQTPREFLDAVEARFDVRLGFDCACTSIDCVTFEIVRTPCTKEGIPNPDGPEWYDTKSLKGYFFDLGVDALQQDWTTIEQPYSWYNPPFHHMAPWARMSCALSVARRAQLEAIAKGELPANTRVFTRQFTLYPAALGSNWFRTYVEHLARTYVLGPRLVFVDVLTGEPFKLEVMDPKTGLQKLDKQGNPKFIDGAINRDTMLVDWGGVPGIETWEWKSPKARVAKAKKVKKEKTARVKKVKKTPMVIE